MTIAQNFSPETQAAIDMLFGSDETAGLAAETASPLSQAAVAAAQQLQHSHNSPLDSKRLSPALALVLANAVRLEPDGTASVRSGERCHIVANDSCTCEDFTHRQLVCKHLLAVAIYSYTQALLSNTPEPAATPAEPASAAWNVHEAPVSCYLKLRLGGMELSYTMRDTDDNKLAARLRQVLPRLQALEAEAETQRDNRKAAKQQAEAQAVVEPATGSAEADIQELVQQALRQVAQSSNSNKPPQAVEPVNDQGEEWCALHREWMPERSNGNGTWNSHETEDDEGGYYCKGRGRPRRRNR